MAVFDNFPYTNLHEMNLDWLIRSSGEVEQLAKETKEVAKSAEDLNNETQEMIDDLNEHIEGIVQEVAVDYLENSSTVQDAIDAAVAAGVYDWKGVTTAAVIYVAGTTGSDDNAGTYYQPVKTLEKAFDQMNKNEHHLWIYVLESGTYDIPIRYFSACCFHLVARASNVTFRWGQADDDAALRTFYNVYVHLEGYSDMSTVFKLRGASTAECYIEAGKLYANRITFDSDGMYFGATGADCTFLDCTFRTKFYVNLGSANFSGCVFQPRTGIIMDCCVGASAESTVGFAGSATFNNVVASDTPYLVKADRASVIFTGSPTVNDAVGDVEYAHITRSVVTGNAAVVRRWVYQVGYVKNAIVEGKWYGYGTTLAGYDSILIAADMDKDTQYEYDENAKSLTFKIQVMSGDTVLARTYYTIACSTLPEETATAVSPAFVYKPSNEDPNFYYISFNTYHGHNDEENKKRVRYLHSFYVPNNGSGVNQDTPTIRVSCWQNFN